MAKKETRPVKERLAESLELPMDTVLNLPKTVIIGNKSVVIDNFKGIIDYDASFFRVNTRESIIKISGDNLEISAITDESVRLCGTIFSVEFLS